MNDFGKASFCSAVVPSPAPLLCASSDFSEAQRLPRANTSGMRRVSMAEGAKARDVVRPCACPSRPRFGVSSSLSERGRVAEGRRSAERGDSFRAGVRSPASARRLVGVCLRRAARCRGRKER